MHNTSLHTNTNTHSYTNITLATPVLSAALNCNFSVCNTTSLAAPIKITFEHEEVEVNETYKKEHTFFDVNCAMHVYLIR